MMRLKKAKLRIFTLTAVLLCLGLPSNGLSQGTFTSEPATVIEAVPSIYPSIALVGNVSGTVVVRAKIKWNGSVGSVDVISGPKLLHKPAKTAAAKWRFNDSGKKNEGARIADLHFIFMILPEGATSQELVPTFLPPYSVKIKEALGRIVPLVSKSTRPGYKYLTYGKP
ncbi:MAG: energy transducer TonB [Pyrinomonadaceae bacterium]